MYRRFIWIALVVAALTAASAATALSLPDRVSLSWVAVLSGANEVPSVDTDAWGSAFFQLSPDGNMLRYQLTVANIVDVFASHIHLAPAGANGPVVVTLYSAEPSGRLDGVIAQGEIRAEDLVGLLAGQPVSALVEAMNAGNTYVNVHTTAHPGGEIRGQIMPANAIGAMARRR